MGGGERGAAPAWEGGQFHFSQGCGCPPQRSDGSWGASEVQTLSHGAQGCGWSPPTPCPLVSYPFSASGCPPGHTEPDQSSCDAGCPPQAPQPLPPSRTPSLTATAHSHEFPPAPATLGTWLPPPLPPAPVGQPPGNGGRRGSTGIPGPASSPGPFWLPSAQFLPEEPQAWGAEPEVRPGRGAGKDLSLLARTLLHPSRSAWAPRTLCRWPCGATGPDTPSSLILEAGTPGCASPQDMPVFPRGVIPA